MEEALGLLGLLCSHPNMHQVKVIQLKVPVSFVTDQRVTRSETGFSFSFSLHPIRSAESRLYTDVL